MPTRAGPHRRLFFAVLGSRELPRERLAAFLIVTDCSCRGHDLPQGLQRQLTFRTHLFASQSTIVIEMMMISR